MKCLTRKKIVLVIVEGVSDDTALGIALANFYDKDTVYIQIMHGDITTKRGNSPQNIVSKVGNVISQFAKSNHYTARDFKQIIHIVDTDGVYIPDDKVIKDLECQGILYETDGIHTTDTQGVINRNKQKRDNLYRLRSCTNIWRVPYRVYYMSCNLDHVLHDKRNSTEKEKENDAYAFAKKYKDNPEGFVKFLCESEFSVKEEFKASWEYIEKEMNSIERYTNLCICLEEENKIKDVTVHTYGANSNGIQPI